MSEEPPDDFLMITQPLSLRIMLALACGVSLCGSSVGAVVMDQIGFYVQHSGAKSPITPGNLNGEFANPDDGLGYGVLNLMNVDYAYAVTVVPESSSITLWILGSLGCLCRRQRGRKAIHPA